MDHPLLQDDIHIIPVKDAVIPPDGPGSASGGEFGFQNSASFYFSKISKARLVDESFRCTEFLDNNAHSRDS